MLGILHLVWYLAPSPLGLTGLSPALGNSLLSGPHFLSFVARTEPLSPLSIKREQAGDTVQSLFRSADLKVQAFEASVL